jgi:hypothetical protein
LAETRDSSRVHKIPCDRGFQFRGVDLMDNSSVTQLQIFSDLHLDVAPIKPIAIADNVDLVIVAGDTCEGALCAFEHLRRIVPMSTPIAMVMGNHEYYRRFLPEELSLARATAPDLNIHLLENDAVTLGRIRLIGATLWTDYRLFGDAVQRRVMTVCGEDLNDHRRIGWSKQPWLRFRPQEAMLLHHRSRAFLATALAEPFVGSTTRLIDNQSILTFRTIGLVRPMFPIYPN